MTFILHEAFRKDPVANPIGTSTGKLEIYCPSLSGFINALGYSTISPIAKCQVEDPLQGVENATKTRNIRWCCSPRTPCGVGIPGLTTCLT